MLVILLVQQSLKQTKEHHCMETLQSGTSPTLYEGLDRSTEKLISEQFDHLSQKDLFQTFNIASTLDIGADGYSDVDRAAISEGAVMSSWLRRTTATDAMVQLGMNETTGSIDPKVHVGGCVLAEVERMQKEYIHQNELVRQQILGCHEKLETQTSPVHIAQLNMDIENLQSSYSSNDAKLAMLTSFEAAVSEDPVGFLGSIEVAMRDIADEVAVIIDQLKSKSVKTEDLVALSQDSSEERSPRFDPIKLAASAAKSVMRR